MAHLRPQDRSSARCSRDFTVPAGITRTAPSRPRRAPAGTGRRRPRAARAAARGRARATPPVEPRIIASSSGSNLSSAAGKPASSSRAARRPRPRSRFRVSLCTMLSSHAPKVPLLPEPGQRGVGLDEGLLDHVVGLGAGSPQHRHPLGDRGMAYEPAGAKAPASPARASIDQLSASEVSLSLVQCSHLVLLRRLVSHRSTPERSPAPWFAVSGGTTVFDAVMPKRHARFEGGSTMPDLSVQLYTVRDALGRRTSTGRWPRSPASASPQVEPFRLVELRRRAAARAARATAFPRRPRTSAC